MSTTTTTEIIEAVKPVRVEAGKYLYKGIAIERVYNGQHYDGSWMVVAENSKYGYESLKKAVAAIDYAERCIARERENAAANSVEPVQPENAKAWEAASKRLNEATDKLNTSFGGITKNYDSWSRDSFEDTTVGITEFIAQQAEWMAQASEALAECVALGEEAKTAQEEFRNAQYRYYEAKRWVENNRYEGFIAIWG